MTERGVCICPNCGCQFSDDKKVALERAVMRAAAEQPAGYVAVPHDEQGRRALVERVARAINGNQPASSHHPFNFSERATAERVLQALDLLPEQEEANG